MCEVPATQEHPQSYIPTIKEPILATLKQHSSTTSTLSILNNYVQSLYIARNMDNYIAFVGNPKPVRNHTSQFNTENCSGKGSSKEEPVY